MNDGKKENLLNIPRMECKRISDQKHREKIHEKGITRTIKLLSSWSMQIYFGFDRWFPLIAHLINNSLKIIVGLKRFFRRQPAIRKKGKLLLCSPSYKYMKEYNFIKFQETNNSQNEEKGRKMRFG